MRNLAGTGRAGWQLLGVDEEFATPVMALDMTGGQVRSQEANAAGYTCEDLQYDAWVCLYGASRPVS